MQRIGEVCVVTGASSGFGRGVALRLARAGATVVLVCRDRDKGERVLREIASAGNAKLAIADLASLRQVEQLADDLLQRLPQIHCLINNAGVSPHRSWLTEDGIEAAFAVNHVAPFLLTKLLLPRLMESAPARIVNVSGAIHRFGKMDFEAVLDPGASGTYPRSKLANVLFTRELAARLDRSGVTVNCLHPGVSFETGLTAAMPRALRLLLATTSRALRMTTSEEEAAENIAHLALSPEVAGTTGAYFYGKRLRDPSRTAQRKDLAVELWTTTERLIRQTAEKR